MYSLKSKDVIICILLLFLINIQFGCGKIELNNKPPHPNPGLDFHHGWHDSMPGMILFTQEYYNPYPGYLCVIDIQSTEEVPLPDSLHVVGGIEWSPDGSKIAFGTLQKGIVVIDNEGTSVITLVSGWDLRSPSWSPDGSMIAFCNYWGRSVRVIDAAYGNVYYSYSSGIYHGPLFLDWSPSGQEILFGGNTVFAILDISDSTFIELSDVHAGEAVWSPDGKYIAYSTSPDGIGMNTICSVKKDGSDIIQIINFDEYNLDFFIQELAWSPDGKMIAVATYYGIYVIDLDGTIVTWIEAENCNNIDWR